MSRRMIHDSATIGLWRLDEAPVSLDPLSISGCVLWLDGQDASTFNTGSPSEGVTVDNWNDKSGNAHHADSKVGTPDYSSAGLNGYPCLHCNGSSELLSTTYSFSQPPLTLFAVARYGSGTKARVITGSGNKLFGWHFGGTWKYYYEGWIEEGSGPADIYAHAICCNISSGSKADFWFDGKLRILQGTGGNGGAALGALTLGGSVTYGEHSDCYIGEVLLYNRILDAGETDRILAWLNAKWNVHAADVSLNVLPASVVGATKVAVTDMPFAYARQLAAGQCIDVPYSSLLQPANPSVECWFRWAGTNGADQYLVSKNNQYHLLYWSAADIFAYYVRSNGSSWIVASYPASSLVVGNWYYLAGTLDGSYVRLYLNGAEANKTAWTGSITYSGSEALGIGNLVTGKTAYFNGRLAEVHLSNRARKPWEIYNTWKGLQARDPVAGFGVEP